MLLSFVQSFIDLFSGNAYQRSADQDFPFSVNRNFYYLTGINQPNVIFVLVKGINAMMSIGKKPAEKTTKKCPYCQSEISIKATRCPHCTSQLEEA